MLIDTSQISVFLSITYTSEQNKGWQAWHRVSTRQSQIISMHETEKCLLLVDKARTKQKLFLKIVWEKKEGSKGGGQKNVYYTWRK